MSRLTAFFRKNVGPVVVFVVVAMIGGLGWGLLQIVEQGAVVKRLAEQADKRDKETRDANAATSANRTAQLNSLQSAVNTMGTTLAEVQGQTALIKDCVGLGNPESECAKTSAERFRSLVKAIVDALRSEFGILKGELRITLVQEPGKPPVISVGGQEPGKSPSVDRPLPPGTVVQECLVELHAEPVVGACAVPR